MLRFEPPSTPEVRQLRENAQRLGEAEIVTLCDEIVKARPRTAGVAPRATKRKAAA
jgi:hypothetical protein